VVAQETVEPAPAAAAAVDEPTVAAAEAPEPIAPEPEPELEPEPEARAPIDVPTPSDEASSYALEIQGLRSRELREVDGIVFTANVLDRDIHYLRAEAYCRNLELSGIGDWRLPTAAELGTISSVVDLGRAPLWTATEGDAKAQSMLVYRDRADEFAVHGRTWRGARALCVRSSSDA
jgi:hypothetical protein